MVEVANFVPLKHIYKTTSKPPPPPPNPNPKTQRTPNNCI